MFYEPFGSYFSVFKLTLNAFLERFLDMKRVDVKENGIFTQFCDYQRTSLYHFQTLIFILNHIQVNTGK